MRRLHRAVHRAALVLIAASGVARSEPAPCRVEIVAAPPDVRAEIEAWVRAEPRCVKQLSVTVTQTDDGYDLYARDSSGHMRERVVPDAQSVAVLVVSWMADDSISAPLAEAEAPVEALRPVTDFEMPPPIATPSLTPSTELVAAPAPHRAERWLSFGVLAGPTGGIRGQIDLIAHKRWTIGVAGALRRSDDRDHMRTEEDDRGYSSARVVAGTHRSFGSLEMRAHIGIGFDATHTTTMTGDHDGKVTPKAEAGVFAGMRIGRTWGLLGGPVVDKTIGDRERGNVALFLGVRHGL
jgi:hypothetical protein